VPVTPSARLSPRSNTSPSQEEEARRVTERHPTMRKSCDILRLSLTWNFPMFSSSVGAGLWICDDARGCLLSWCNAIGLLFICFIILVSSRICGPTLLRTVRREWLVTLLSLRNVHSLCCSPCICRATIDLGPVLVELP
jgi:hypothetical protein